jgi:hypothetical protein
MSAAPLVSTKSKTCCRCRALNHDGDTSIVFHVSADGGSSSAVVVYKGKNVWEKLPNQPNAATGVYLKRGGWIQSRRNQKGGKRDIVIN